MSVGLRISRGGGLLPPPGPVRLISVLGLVNSTGNGIWFALSALYFTRILGFPVLEVGIGLSVAGAFGLLAGVPIGHLADRRGPREILVLTFVMSAIASASVLLVASYWQFVALVSVLAFFASGSSAVRAAMIAAVATGSDRAVSRAYIRAVTNVGVGLGTAVAAIALHEDTRAVYIAIMLLDAISYLVCAFLTVGLPRVPPAERDRQSNMLTAVRDVPYLTVTLLTAIMALHYEMVAIGVPLWVVEHTDAPRWTVSLLLLLNSVVVITTQVAVAKRVVSVRSAVGASALSGLLLFESCIVFGLSSSVGAVLATVALVGAILLQVLGELTQAAASFVLGFDLALDDAQGQYQGLFNSAMALSALLGPTVVALLPLGLGPPGWWALGGLMLAAGLALGPAVRWAERTRTIPSAAIGDPV